MQGFLFGKLPAFGDFVSRGLSVPMRSWWDNWCSAEILDAQRRFKDDFEPRYEATAIRRFVIAPLMDDGRWQAGCLVRSFDRAGRAFPFVLGIGSSVPIDPSNAAALGERLAACVDRAFEPSVELDTLIAAVEVAAGAAGGATRSAEPIAAGQIGWIGNNPHSFEVS